MAQGRLRKAVDKSIKAAASCGDLDLERNAAPIAMLRYMADRLDSDSGKTPMLRYVTPPSFLNYCEALGLTPAPEAAKRDGKQDKPRVVSVAGNSRWGQRAANG